MKKWHDAGWCPALLVVALSLSVLRLSGASGGLRHKKPPSKKNLVGTLRAALTSKIEELHNQKNIAHGLELEVRELQSELQAEKKALASETAKEHGLQLKLNKVRAALDDTSSSSANVTKGDGGDVVPSPQHVSPPEHVVPPTATQVVVLPPLSEADPIAKAIKQISVEAPVQPVEVAQSDLERAGDNSAQQTHEDLVPGAHQQIAQDAPPFAENSPTNQSLPGNTPTAVVAPETKSTVMSAAKKTAEKPEAIAKRAAPQLRASPAARKQSTPAAPPPAARSTSVVATATRESGGAKGAGAGADFDALEAQLHEEDRRIQDLDRENALDAIADAGLPPGVTASNHTPLKSLPAQPKLELDSEAPMEDFLNVEPPVAESTGEAATSAAPAADKAPTEVGLALPQVAESVGTGFDGALSDEKFLSQMAPASSH